MKKVRSIDASDGYQPDGIFLTVLAVVVARAGGGGGGGNGNGNGVDNKFGESWS